MAFVLGAAACGGDSTGPPPTAELTIENVNVRGPSVLWGDSEPQVRCDVRFRARASGKGSVTFRGARFMFFAGVDRSAPVDVIEFSAQEVQDVWGDVLEAGKTVESVWWFQLGAPFVLTGEFLYAPYPGALNASAPVRVVCGPESPESSPLPAITDVSLASPADGLEPTDTLFVSYTATAALGMWQTAIELTGPCSVSVEVDENLPTSITRTVPLPIPAGCSLGVPSTVTVHAVDAALRRVSRQSTGPSLVDHTPPRIDATVLAVPGAMTSAIQFSGDSIDVRVSAFDNAGLRAIVYELLPVGLRDSVVISPTFNGTLGIPVPSDVTGFIQLRLYARDVTGLTSNEFITAPGAIKVYPTVERTTLRSTLRAWVRDIAIDADHGLIYVLVYNESHIYVLSSASLDVMRTIELPVLPTSIDFTPSGDSLIVTGGLELTVVDLRQPAPVVTELPLALDESTVQRAIRVVILANGKAYVAVRGTSPQSNQLLEITLATGDQRTRTDAADNNGVARASSIQRSPDHLAFVFNGGFGHFRRYDATTDQFTVGGNATPYDVGFSLDRGGQHNALSLDIYDASLTFVRRVESIVAPGAVVPAAISPGGVYLYHLTPSGMLRSRVSDGLLIDRTRLPVAADFVRIAGDESFLVTWSTATTGQLSLIRLR